MNKPIKLKLVNAQNMHKKYPKTFELSTQKEMECIKKGYFVKICDNKERFWVSVIKRDNDILIGKVSNILLSGFPKYGKQIIFNINNVYSFMKGK